MLRASPDSWLSWQFSIFDENKAIAKIDIAWVREAGTLHLQGTDYRVYREKLLSGAFILEKDGTVIARAEKPSALTRSFKVTCDGRNFVLEAESAFLRAFVLRENEQTIGTIKPEHAFTRNAVVDLPADMALPVRIFMIWLTFILWKRDADSAT